MVESFLDLLDTKPDIWMKSFWGWSPDSWGGVGFTNEARTKTIIDKTADPFLMIINVTKTVPQGGHQDLKGRLVGAYELTHVIKSKSELMPTWQMERDHHPKMAWQYMFEAKRAWTLTSPVCMDDFYPELYAERRAQAVSTWAEKLPASQVNKLKLYKWDKTDLYTKDSEFTGGHFDD